MPASTTLHSDIEATVKFFDAAKGFGFVEVSDGSPDAYLPAALVREAGYKGLVPGMVIFCQIVQGPKNPEVAAIHFVDEIAAQRQPVPASSHRRSPSAKRRAARRPTESHYPHGGK